MKKIYKHIVVIALALFAMSIVGSCYYKWESCYPTIMAYSGMSGSACSSGCSSRGSSPSGCGYTSGPSHYGQSRVPRQTAPACSGPLADDVYADQEIVYPGLTGTRASFARAWPITARPWNSNNIDMDEY